MWALRQYTVAKKIVKRSELTMTHAFFSLMGGFIVTDQGRTPDHVLVLESAYQSYDYFDHLVKIGVGFDDNVKSQLDIFVTASSAANSGLGFTDGDIDTMLGGMTTIMMTTILKLVSESELLQVILNDELAIRLLAMNAAKEGLDIGFPIIIEKRKDEILDYITQIRLRNSLQDRLQDRLRDSLQGILPERLRSRRETLEKDIRDKNKQDSLAKTFALAQTTWFVVQCIVRRAQHLPLTEIELMTCAYATLNAAIYFFWWHKPFRADCPIMILSDIPCEELRKEHTSEITELNVWDITTWAKFLVGGVYDNYNFCRRLQVPTFYSGCMGENLWNFIMEIITAAVFGGIHLLAWNYEFPTRVELWLWRVSALIIVGIPPIAFFFLLVLSIKEDSHASRWSFVSITRYFLSIIVLLYIIARLIILVLAVVSLRKLPVETLYDVDWLKLIPHIE
ncbi:hypothetical protein Clacol_001011 [Clathrus columnatus]|uniref:Uncharacterized protein n=1 Tax=Clathrus columnatus TaxID=1419009 RepID=A0AAV5A1D6_9AGAM|nr:hypothetical protein Clacol_001011 [Clathrus columnatus]